jgi:hypothetical protein
MKYEIKFDKNNPNTILIYSNNKIVNMIACPPVEKSCDVIDLNNNLKNGYNFNFDGLILITTKINRTLYYNGDIIAETNR